MGANLDEKVITAKSWRRARHINIENTYGQIPRLTFACESITVDADTNSVLLTKPDMFPVQLTCDDLSKTIALRNPMTGEEVGATATYQDLMVILYSLFMQEVK